MYALHHAFPHVFTHNQHHNRPHTVLASRQTPDQHLMPLQDTSSSAHTLLHTAAGIKPPTLKSDITKKEQKQNGSIDFEDQDPSIKSHWALLVAGSAGWFNYRHQADVYHAYQLLLAGGYLRDHIVVMAADDLAQDPENPMPGKVFNRPGTAACAGDYIMLLNSHVTLSMIAQKGGECWT